MPLLKTKNGLDHWLLDRLLMQRYLPSPSYFNGCRFLASFHEKQTNFSGFVTTPWHRQKDHAFAQFFRPLSLRFAFCPKFSTGWGKGAFAWPTSFIPKKMRGLSNLQNIAKRWAKNFENHCYCCFEETKRNFTEEQLRKGKNGRCFFLSLF